MRAIEFTVLGKPITQGSKQAFVRGGRAVIVDVSNKATKTMPAKRLDKWRDQVAGAARVEMASVCPWPGPIRLDLEFVLPRPKSHYTKAGVFTKSAPHHHVTKPDRGKLARAVEDAMSGIVYGDDSQIMAGETTKRYAARGGYPGVVIRVRRMT